MLTGLIRRSGRYSTRRVIPLDLQAHYGRREIVRALGTPFEKEAKKLHVRMWQALDDEFDKARAALGCEAHAGRETGPRPAPPTQSGPRIPHPWEALDRESFEWEIEKIEAQWRASDLDEAEYDAREGLRAQLEARLAAPVSELTAEDQAVLDLLKDATFKAEVAQQQAAFARSMPRPQRADSSTPSTTHGSARAHKGTSLSAVVDNWAAERKPKPRTVTRTRNIVSRFEAVAGALPVETFTKHHVLSFKDKLLQDGQTPGNINVLIPMLGTVFIHAMKKMHLIEVNPATGIGVADMRRAKEKRRAFSEAELTAIFESSIYTDNLRPQAGGGEASFWLPILALYTGGRQTELGQLHPDDVILEAYADQDGAEHKAWVIRFVENPERNQWVKNEGSERRVPVHPTLIALGFIDVAKRAIAEKRERIFPDITPNAQGELMGNWSKWFGRYRRKRCGLLTKDTPFHSFRHSFKHYARLSSINSEVHHELTGHETGDTGDDYGGLSFPLHPLVEAIKRYRVPGVPIPAPSPFLR